MPPLMLWLLDSFNMPDFVANIKEEFSKLGWEFWLLQFQHS